MSSDQQIPSDSEQNNDIAQRQFEQSIHSNQATQASINYSIYSSTIGVLKHQFSTEVKQFVPHLFVDKNKFLKPFNEYLKRNNKKSMKLEVLYNQNFNLICTPIFVLIYPNEKRLKYIYQELKNENFGAQIVFNKKNEKQIKQKIILWEDKIITSYQNEIIFQPDTQQPFYFRIKEVPSYGKQKQADLLIDIFFDCYLTVSGFREFAAYLFHWCNSRRILSSKYLSVSAFKLILIYSLNLINIPNIIHSYKALNKHNDIWKKIQLYDNENIKNNQSEINALPNFIVQQCYEKHILQSQIEIIKQKNKQLEKEEKIYQNQKNASDQQKLCLIKSNKQVSFAQSIKQPFSSSINEKEQLQIVYKIRYIPFPVIPKQMNQFKQKFKKQNSQIFQSKSLGEWIFQFFRFYSKVFTPEHLVRIDLASKQVFKKQKSVKPSIEIIHPVFEYNLTNHLKTKQKEFKQICQQFTRAYDHIKTGKIQDMIMISDKYLD